MASRVPVLSLLTGDTLVPTRPLASMRAHNKSARSKTQTWQHFHTVVVSGDSIMRRGLSDYMSGIQSAGKVIHKIAMPHVQRVISISRLWLHCSSRVKWIEILFMFLFLDWFSYHLLYGAWFGMFFLFFFFFFACISPAQDAKLRTVFYPVFTAVSRLFVSRAQEGRRRKLMTR